MEKKQKIKRCISIKEYIRDIIIDSVVDEENCSRKVVAFICHVFWLLLAFSAILRLVAIRPGQEQRNGMRLCIGSSLQCDRGGSSRLKPHSVVICKLTEI